MRERGDIVAVKPGLARIQTGAKRRAAAAKRSRRPERLISSRVRLHAVKTTTPVTTTVAGEMVPPPPGESGRHTPARVYLLAR